MRPTTYQSQHKVSALRCRDKNWINCKKSWCNYELKDLFTMCNNTTNRIEAHHRVLKLHFKSSASLCWNLEKLLIIIHHYRHVDSHLDFLEKMCITIDTTYSAHKIVQEYKKASAKKYQIIESGNCYKVCGTFTYEVSVSFTSCTCQFFSAMHLPCRHLFFMLLQQVKIFLSQSPLQIGGLKNTMNVMTHCYLTRMVLQMNCKSLRQLAAGNVNYHSIRSIGK